MLTNSMACGVRGFNAAFTRALQQTLSWAELTQFFVLAPIYLIAVLKLSSQESLGGLFLVGLPVNICV